MHDMYEAQLHAKERQGTLKPLSPLTPRSNIFISTFWDNLKQLNVGTHNYVLTCIDAFSKFIELIPLRNITAHTMAEAIFERIICTFGCFQTISNDRGSQFYSSLLKHLNTLTGFKHIFTTTAHHTVIGQVERVNQSVERILAKDVNFERNEWDNSLSLAKYAINISVVEATGLSPYVVTYEREPRTALDTALRK